MNKRIDHFLLGILWCLAVVLGAMFWFDTMFGFNLFDARHWEYLGGLQASGAAVNIWFYVYMVLSVAIALGGLYIIIRPRFRKIKLYTETKETVAEPIDTVIDEIKTAELEQADQPSSLIHNPSSIPSVRPPRLNIPHRQTPVLPRPESTSSLTPNSSSIDLDPIFTDAGFIVKKPPKIVGVRPAVFAIGPGEVLWIGMIDANPATIVKSVERLRALFIETLEDITININAFIINPTAPTTGDIMSFDSVDALREYIAAHPAEQNENTEDMNAYSEYIDTVADYLDKQ